MSITGEIRIFAFNYAPGGWLRCEGQSLQASGYYGELFSVIGQAYGGNATDGTFNLPDLRSRVMMNMDPNDSQIATTGVTGGEESVTLIPDMAAPHSHSLNIAVTPNGIAVNGASIAQSVAMDNEGTVLSFAEATSLTKLNSGTIDYAGGGAAHENRMPSLALTVCIATFGMPDMPFIGEIRPFAFESGSEGWSVCDGSVLQITAYPALGKLLGNTFGGDGKLTFGLPDLRGRAAVACGQGTGLSSYTLGQAFGTESVSLTVDEMPAHNHDAVVCNDTAVSSTPQGEFTYLAARECPVEGSLNSFIPADQPVATLELNANTIGMGAGNPHENRQPFLAINYMICNYGVYPQNF
jgi:microcystin-dependent protein